MIELVRIEGDILRMKKKLDDLDPEESYAVAHLEKAAADLRFARFAILRKKTQTKGRACTWCHGKGWRNAPAGNVYGPNTERCSYCDGTGNADG